MTEEGSLVGDRYRLIERIGSGAVADVWRACDERLTRDVAIKMFRGDAGEDLGDAQEEVRLLAGLDHPNLVGIFDAGTEGELSYVVMRLVTGVSLADRLRTEDKLDSLETARIGAEIAAALGYIHEQGLIHRDVKPHNVLVGEDGRVALADFGIARLIDSPRRTMTGQVLGTPAYLAPEQVSGAAITPAVDIYALGLVLLECLTGRREFPGTAMESAMARISRDPEVPADLPGPWFSLVVAMTARDPVLRPGAAEVEQRLRDIAAGTAATMVVPAPTAVTQVVPPPPPGDRTAVLTSAVPPAATDVAPVAAPRRSRLGAGILATVLLLVVAAAVVVAVVVHQREQVHNYFTPGQPPTQVQPLEGDLQRLETAVR